MKNACDLVRDVIFVRNANDGLPAWSYCLSNKCAGCRVQAKSAIAMGVPQD